MNTTAKLSAYGAALALIVTGAFAVGTAVGPLATTTAAPAGAGAGHGDAHSGTVAGTATDRPGGLASSRGGYTCAPTDPTLSPGTTPTVFSFRITGPDGAPVTAFDGAGITLGTDLAAPGSYEPVVHTPSRTAQVDGYTVELVGDLVPRPLTAEGIPGS